MKICRGNYAEVQKAVIEYDGDYLMGTLTIRVVANGFDNVRNINYPDCYGLLIGEKSPEELGDLVRTMTREMKSDLYSIFKFPQDTVDSLQIPLIKTKN